MPGLSFLGKLSDKNPPKPPATQVPAKRPTSQHSVGSVLTLESGWGCPIVDFQSSLEKADHFDFAFDNDQQSLASSKFQHPIDESTDKSSDDAGAQTFLATKTAGSEVASTDSSDKGRSVPGEETHGNAKDPDLSFLQKKKDLSPSKTETAIPSMANGVAQWDLPTRSSMSSFQFLSGGPQQEASPEKNMELDAPRKGANLEPAIKSSVVGSGFRGNLPSVVQHTSDTREDVIDDAPSEESKIIGIPQEGLDSIVPNEGLDGGVVDKPSLHRTGSDETVATTGSKILKQFSTSLVDTPSKDDVASDVDEEANPGADTVLPHEPVFTVPEPLRQDAQQVTPETPLGDNSVASPSPDPQLTASRSEATVSSEAMPPPANRPPMDVSAHPSRLGNLLLDDTAVPDGSFDTKCMRVVGAHKTKPAGKQALEQISVGASQPYGTRSAAATENASFEELLKIFMEEMQECRDKTEKTEEECLKISYRLLLVTPLMAKHKRELQELNLRFQKNLADRHKLHQALDSWVGTRSAPESLSG